MINCEDYFCGLTEEQYQEETKRHHEQLRDNCILSLIDKYAKKHDLAKRVGAEYIWQDDEAQVDAIELVGKIFDLFAEEASEEEEEEWK